MPLSRIFLVLPALCLLFTSAFVLAADVRVVGLFKGRAVVDIDGKQRILRIGQTSPEGIRLVSADSESALLEIEGEQIRAPLDSRISARKKSRPMSEVQIRRRSTM